MSEEIAAEIFEERAGICEFSGLMTREQSEAMGMLESEKYRQACEVRTVLAMPLRAQTQRGLGLTDRRLRRGIRCVGNR